MDNIFDFVGNDVMAIEWDNRPVNKAGEEFYVRGVTVSYVRWGKITGAMTFVLEYDVLARRWGEESSAAAASRAG